jgi:hypothetical protein
LPELPHLGQRSAGEASEAVGPDAPRDSGGGLALQHLGDGSGGSSEHLDADRRGDRVGGRRWERGNTLQGHSASVHPDHGRIRAWNPHERFPKVALEGRKAHHMRVTLNGPSRRILSEPIEKPTVEPAQHPGPEPYPEPREPAREPEPARQS